MSPNKIVKALRQQVVIVAAHLDFEGVAYLKVLPDGKGGCFASDYTSQVVDWTKMGRKKAGLMEIPRGRKK